MHLVTCDNLTTLGLLSYMLLSAVLKAVTACTVIPLKIRPSNFENK